MNSARRLGEFQSLVPLGRSLGIEVKDDDADVALLALNGVLDFAF